MLRVWLCGTFKWESIRRGLRVTLAISERYTHWGYLVEKAKLKQEPRTGPCNVKKQILQAQQSLYILVCGKICWSAFRVRSKYPLPSTSFLESVFRYTWKAFYHLLKLQYVPIKTLPPSPLSPLFMGLCKHRKEGSVFINKRWDRVSGTRAEACEILGMTRTNLLEFVRPPCKTPIPFLL